MGRRLLVGTSFGGGTVPPENVVAASDFLLLHGNGVSDPDRIARDGAGDARRSPATGRCRSCSTRTITSTSTGRANNFVAAVGEYASWGHFDFRMKGEGFDEGYQSVPVNWGISSARKRAFFGLLKEMTGS